VRRYLEHEKEHGREAPEMEALLRDLDAHSKLDENDKRTVRDEITGAPAA
jgi:hypothetical protein